MAISVPLSCCPPPNPWQTTYTGSGVLGTGQTEYVILPSGITASGSSTIIKNDLHLYITDVSIRPIGDGYAPRAVLEVDSSLGSEAVLFGVETRLAWHGVTPIHVVGNESESRRLQIRSAGPGADQFVITIFGYAK